MLEMTVPKTVVFGRGVLAQLTAALSPLCRNAAMRLTVSIEAQPETFVNRLGLEQVFFGGLK